jgi:hypothetical protein
LSALIVSGNQPYPWKLDSVWGHLQQQVLRQHRHDSVSEQDGMYFSFFFPHTFQDLFAQKIARIPLRKYFPEFDGPEGDAAAAKKFILGVSASSIFLSKQKCFPVTCRTYGLI